MIAVTPKAASKIVSNIDRRGAGIGIRLGTRTTGCSGLAYVLEYVDDLEETDHVFDSDGFKICHLYTSPSPRDRQKSRMPSSA